MSKPMTARPRAATPEETLAKVQGIINEVPPAAEALPAPAPVAATQQQEAPPAAALEAETAAPATDWRVLPKKVPTTQFNVRIRSDLHEVLNELATYTPGESMTKIAARGIETEIRRMMAERGIELK